MMANRDNIELPTISPRPSRTSLTSSTGTLVHDAQHSSTSQLVEDSHNQRAPATDVEAGRASRDDPPYHVFSKRHKWLLVCLASLAGCLSPLSSNIYFPAITSISLDLGVSTSQVAITITVYMVVQGISPSLFGAISDAAGRRLTLVMALAIYTAANLGLAFTLNFPMLLVLRGVQAAGSASTISISVGVISDIATPRERGGFMGTNSGMR